jgi:hypothetical protein
MCTCWLLLTRNHQCMVMNHLKQQFYVCHPLLHVSVQQSVVRHYFAKMNKREYISTVATYCCAYVVICWIQRKFFCKLFKCLCSNAWWCFVVPLYVESGCNTAIVPNILAGCTWFLVLSEIQSVTINSEHGLPCTSKASFSVIKPTEALIS